MRYFDSSQRGNAALNCFGRLASDFVTPFVYTHQQSVPVTRMGWGGSISSPDTCPGLDQSYLVIEDDEQSLKCLSVRLRWLLARPLSGDRLDSGGRVASIR